MSALVSLSPLVTAFLAWAVLGERLLPAQLVGMVAVVGGVALVQLSKRETSAGHTEIERGALRHTQG